MEKNDRETRDFMKVESFSELPFIRPAPPPFKDTNANGGAIIRLFGQEFVNINKDNRQSNLTENNNLAQGGDSNNIENVTNRKFECHYCYRNFPTSQALGGHQNAHKRERQQAKRAQLQSKIGLSDGMHVYGLMNYNRASTLPAGYTSWNRTNSLYSSVYNMRLPAGYGSYNASPQPQPQPINGSPLGLWRNISTAHFGSSARKNSLLVDSRDDVKVPLAPNSQVRFERESKPHMQDHVSLDLHL